MNATDATPLQCHCPNCGRRLADIIEGVVQVKCPNSRNQLGERCGHLIRFTRAPGSNKVFAFDLDAPPAK